ncbi:MAG: hypothetical protein QNJ00_13065 [Woeseiaceae bacterium]|nr:hypothetical protein [Woeseiaceae bacterium]
MTDYSRWLTPSKARAYAVSPLFLDRLMPSGTEAFKNPVQEGRKYRPEAFEHKQ